MSAISTETDEMEMELWPDLLDNTLITVVVEHFGTETTGHLHKQLLWHKVPNIPLESAQGPVPMETSFNDSPVEEVLRGAMSSLYLPQVWRVRDCPRAVFGMFVTWLYGGHPLPGIDEERTVERYVRLYRLCNDFQVDSRLRDEIVQQLYIHFNRPQHDQGLRVIGDVYRHTRPDDKLRDMISGFLAAVIHSGRLLTAFREDGKKELTKMMDKAPTIRRDVLNWIFTFDVQDEAINQIGDAEAHPWKKFCEGR